MLNQFSRTKRVLGERAMGALLGKVVAIFGLGGVGGNACDALARSGVRHFVLIDNDEVTVTNINRQLIATLSTVGRSKVDVMEEHIHAIDPSIIVEKRKVFYLPENAEAFDFAKYDYVVDAIDTVSAKIDIISRCYALNVPVISALGCGNKVEPTFLAVADLYETTYDPLAKVLRRELRKRGVERLKVVYSKEPPLTPLDESTEGEREEPSSGKRAVPGSTAFVPPVAGIIIASEVVKDLTQFDRENR